MHRWLSLRLEAPLMSFGGVMVDAYGMVDAWPSASLLTGLFANALGYDRTEGERLQHLQDRLIHACALVRPGERMRDFQTAELAGPDQGWTTRGVPEGREGGANTYQSPHLRWRDYWADRAVAIVARLRAETPAVADELDLDGVAAALHRPVRPLFVGRKPCLPSAPLFAGFVEAADPRAALRLALLPTNVADTRAVWPDDKDQANEATSASRSFRMTDRRDWRSGVHAGWSLWREGPLGVEPSPPPGSEAAG